MKSTTTEQNKHRLQRTAELSSKQQTETETETNLESKTKNRIELERNEQIYGQLII